MSFRLLIAALLVIASGVGSCGPGAREPDPSAPLRIVVTIPPLQGLVEALAPAGASVRALMPPGRSEHGYEFTPSDIAAVGKADVVVYVGLWLEPAVDKFVRQNRSNRRRAVVLGEVLGIKTDDHAHHHHAPDEPCDHAVDVHVWLDPELVRQAVPALRRAVEEAQDAAGRLHQAERTRLDQAESSLLTRLSELDAEHRAALAPLRGAAIVTHHAAFSRLAERYGLKVAAVLRPIEGNDPTPAQIAAVVEAIQREKIGVIFVEPQFSPAAASRIAERTGTKIGRLDPLGSGDYFTFMRANLKELVEKLTPPSAP